MKVAVWVEDLDLKSFEIRELPAGTIAQMGWASARKAVVLGSNLSVSDFY